MIFSFLKYGFHPTLMTIGHTLPSSSESLLGASSSPGIESGGYGAVLCGIADISSGERDTSGGASGWVLAEGFGWGCEIGTVCRCGWVWCGVWGRRGWCRLSGMIELFTGGRVREMGAGLGLGLRLRLESRPPFPETEAELELADVDVPGVAVLRGEATEEAGREGVE